MPITTYDDFLYATNALDNHNKYYVIARIGRYVILRWGRIGTKGQYKLNKYGLEGNARYFAQDQMSKKVSEGYKKSKPPTDVIEDMDDFIGTIKGITNVSPNTDYYIKRDEQVEINKRKEKTVEEKRKETVDNIFSSIIDEDDD